jgi:hypothetical protein
VTPANCADTTELSRVAANAVLPVRSRVYADGRYI